MCYSIIMKKTRYSATKLVDLFKQQKIASMQELKGALGTRADATVFRKLSELSYLSSYSHRGWYYTLGSIPVFDQWGLWSFRSVWFSERGTLLATAQALIGESEQGFFETELESLLNVEVRGSLLKLIQKTVARLLKQLGFSLRVNQKKVARTVNVSPQERDAQFSHIAELRELCGAGHVPVISVDTKKKELIGNFKNAGQTWVVNAFPSMTTIFAHRPMALPFPSAFTI
jgi:hypothetical protein